MVSFLPYLKTPRLLLRPATLRDSQQIYQMASNPAVTRYMTWGRHENVASSIDFLQRYALANYESGIPDPFVLERTENPGVVIGCCGCSFTTESHAMELGYWLGEKWWGQGYAAEAARRVLDYAFDEFVVERIVARCMIENAPSWRVMERLGMVREGILRHGLFKNGRFVDVIQYSLLREEWNRLQCSQGKT